MTIHKLPQTSRLLIAILSALSLASAHAQEQAAPIPSAAVRALSVLRVSVVGEVEKPNLYKMQKGDTLRKVLAQAGVANLNTALQNVTILRGGQTLTVDALAAVQAGKPSDFVLQDGDIVAVLTRKALSVAVSGEVQNPGVFELREGDTLQKLLSQANVLNPAHAVLRVTLKHGTETFTFDIGTVQADKTLDLRLSDGDVVAVRTVKALSVAVSGEVRNPGVYQLQEGEALLELLVRAGGSMFDAALKSLTIKRGGQTFTVDALAAVKAGKPLNFVLQDGDFVSVPKNSNRVFVMKAVLRPGYQPIPEDEPLTLGQALAVAGGTSYDADLPNLIVLHKTTRQEAGQEAQDTQLQIHPFELKGQNSGVNFLLQTGDVIYVPEKERVRLRYLLEPRLFLLDEAAQPAN